jgi:hypothetical protein
MISGILLQEMTTACKNGASAAALPLPRMPCHQWQERLMRQNLDLRQISSSSLLPNAQSHAI